MGRDLTPLRVMRNHPAYHAGKAAFAQHRPHTDNPNAAGSVAQTQWGFGWLEAKSAYDQQQARLFLERMR
jgi:hypothetical protein